MLPQLEQQELQKNSSIKIFKRGCYQGGILFLMILYRLNSIDI